MNLMPHDFATNLVIWAVVVAVLVAWQVATMVSARLPSFGALIRLTYRKWLLRWGLVVWWSWLGWHLFVRTFYD